MFVLQFKEVKEIPLKEKKLIVIECRGCYEIICPKKEIMDFKNSLKSQGYEFEELIFDYICNFEFSKKRIEKYYKEINEIDEIILISCGVGAQTISSILTWKRIYIACNTIYLPGLQGLTPQDYDCQACGECKLNYTAGICPVTLCSKGLLNGPCGGTTVDGKCEINDSKVCIWVKIFENLKSYQEYLKSIPNVLIHNFKSQIIVRETIRS